MLNALAAVDLLSGGCKRIAGESPPFPRSAPLRPGDRAGRFHKLDPLQDQVAHAGFPLARREGKAVEALAVSPYAHKHCVFS
jgi:hypothetical protein